MAANQSAVGPVLSAVIAVLRADPTLIGLLAISPVDRGAGVYEELAPEKAGYPYLVVNQAGAVPANTIGRGWGAAVLIYCRATARKRDVTKAIASRVIALLDTPTTALTVAGYPSVMSELVSDGPGYPEDLDADPVHHYPVAIRVTVSTV